MKKKIEPKELPNVTLISVCGNKYGETIAAMSKSLKQIKPARAVFLSDTDTVIDGVECIKIRPLKSWEAYNEFIIKDLHLYFGTSHCLLIQWDGFVIDGSRWDDKFLEYDVLGAKWLYSDGRNCGNGGFTLRSKRLQTVVATDPNIEITAPEDEAIGRLYRKYLEDRYNIKFAPDDVCDRFSFELNPPTQPTFGFHAFHHDKFKEHIIIRRSYALGDVLMTEPLLAYYNDLGYQVVLDTPSQNMQLFFGHPFKIKHISEMDARITPARFINLDGCYENKPKQSVIESYFEEAGVADYKPRNSKLYFKGDGKNKLFKKYAVLHLDDTGVAHRNIRGLTWQWDYVKVHLERKGYTVFQVGAMNSQNKIGEWVNTSAIQFLVYLLAGADLVLGLDSGVTQISVALGRPTAIMFGSVNPELRYTDFSKIEVIRNACPIKKDYCYHEANDSETGSDCEADAKNPPCCVFNEWQIMKSIDILINKTKDAKAVHE